jgi:hypothetical protein
MMIRTQNIDNLTMSLLSNTVLRDSFVANPASRLEALANHNKIASRKYGMNPVELNEAERQLITSLSVTTIQQFYEGLAEALDQQARQVHRQTVRNSLRVLKPSAA